MVDDRDLLKDLQAAVQATADQGHTAQAAAIESVLAQHGATVADINRLLSAATSRRNKELTGLQARIEGLIEGRATAEETAAAVDRFLRSYHRG